MRPRLREDTDAGVWCNFTVSIRQDDDYDVDDVDLQNDQQQQQHQQHQQHQQEEVNDQLPDDMIEYGDFAHMDDYDAEEDVEDAEDVAAVSSGPRAATFTRYKKMEAVQSMVKPAGATITYKCPADGQQFVHHFHFHLFSPN